MTSGCICKFVQSKRAGYYRYIVVVDRLKLPRHDRPPYHKIPNPYHQRNSSTVLGVQKGSLLASSVMILNLGLMQCLPTPLGSNSLKSSRSCHQGRAVGAVAGATRAFGRRTQGVWGRAPQPPEASSVVIKP